MATRTVITAEVVASPDHLHTFAYKLNEQYVIGSYLMPQPLSTKLVAMSKATEDSTALSTAEIARNAVAAHVFDKDGPETAAYDTTDPRWVAHIAAWHRS